MHDAIENSITRLDIGLSKEDQARIDALRSVKLEKNRKTKSLFTQTNDWLVSLGGVKLRDKVVFFQLLSVMINAGVPIIRSLFVLSEQVQNAKLKGVIRGLGAEMEQGKSLSVAMIAHEKIFTEAERGMIASGEASGTLNEILKDIARQAEKSAAIIAKVKGAMVYPASIFCIMIICVTLMLTMVVPKLTAFFTEGGQELPMTTQILLKTSEAVQDYWAIGLVIAAAAIAGLALVGKSKQGKYSIDMALLYLPVFGGIIRELMVSRFARLLASLMHAGVPIVKSLEINANAVGNEVYKRRIQFAAQDVAQGIPLGENLNNSSALFPPTVASMVMVGEQTANLEEVASKIAEFYESEVDNAAASLSKLMEPLILVVMGALVAFIVAAIMQPILSLSDLASVL